MRSNRPLRKTVAKIAEKVEKSCSELFTFPKQHDMIHLAEKSAQQTLARRG